MNFFYILAVNLCWLYTRLFYSATVTGNEHLPHNTGYILTANHISYFDPFIIAKHIPVSVRFMALIKFFKVPVIGFLMKQWQTIPINNERIDRNAITVAIDLLKQDEIIGIFPEGGISKSGPPKKLQTGVAMLAMHAQKPIVPVHIEGTRDLYRPNIFKRKQITISFKKPLYIENIISQLENRTSKTIRTALINSIEQRLFA